MKNTINILVFALLATGFLACNDAPEGEQVDAGEKAEQSEGAEAAAQEGTIYMVDTDASKVNWVGSKLVGDQHTGYINIKNGTLTVNEGNIVGGTFTLDITSLTDTDLAPDDGKEKLEGHLKSDDFFNVSKYPEGTFEVIEVKQVGDKPDATHQIVGNLTLKGITKSVTIPATVNMTENKLMASTPQFTIDRTEWNVMYGSSGLGLAKDKIINDRVGLSIELQAAPKEEMTEKVDS